MTATLSLAWRLLRAGGRRDGLTVLLSVAAFAVTTTLLLLVLAGNVGFAERAGHKNWRQPVPAKAAAAAIEATSQQQLRNHTVTVVELAPLRGDAPVPPGLRRFPSPGELWVSPALGRMLAGVPASEFADRFGGHPAGELGRAALAYPDELVAVVGHRADDPRLAAAPLSGYDQTAPTRIASFAGTHDRESDIYLLLARFATALLVVPLLVLGAAAARLGVSRRTARLAAMRLVGATPGQVVALTAVESMVAAAAGALAGGLLYLAVVPAAAHIRLGGGAWYPGDLLLPPLLLVAALAGVVLLSGLSAVVGLRSVVVSPLGVAQRQTPRKLRAIRLVVVVALMYVFSAVSGGKNTTVIVTALGLLFGSLALVGPWVIGLLGRLVAAVGRGPATLLAARRLVDDPRTAWRTVGGLALAGFVAGFVALIPDVNAVATHTPANQLQVSVAHDTGTVAVGRLNAALATAGLQGHATLDADSIKVTVPAGDPTMDRTRTVVARTLPGAPVIGAAEERAAGGTVIGDLPIGTILVLAATFLVAMASAGITNAAAVLDRRRTYAQLRLAGTPLSVLDRARALETLLPLVLLGLGSISLGVFAAAPLMDRAAGSASNLASSGVLQLAGCVAVGVAGIVAASAASRPLLAAVTRDPGPQPS